MAPDAFYQTAAQVCFTLLGLWWIVLQTKYAEWIGRKGLRRMATHISLYFLPPGAMSLTALASHARLLWATAFVIASLFGGIESAYALRSLSTRAQPRRPWYAYVPLGPGLAWRNFAEPHEGAKA